ncbi:MULTISPECIES: Wzt carbohydrate-binding domain-containing protein [unclassified Clostridium]|uniref:Wzt carbohydrate-binding domain-containing protein n=1 Tax=unclassified Clostridium TaxID=2614128 RepID=UPI00029753B1|nr:MULTISPECIES: Wzt carbohydrate-binding domain-containing protein [unclassified Clostridium]EKQ50524.1 MAG: Sulfotransferase family [Clostridium sp. Maddingley MBC34-26]
MYDKYFFLHIPKAAGTSLFKIYNDILGEENVKQFVSINKGSRQMEVLNRYPFLGGHTNYLEYLKYFSEDRYSITFLRNPINRFLSQYFYYKNNVGESRETSVVNAKKLDLKSYIEHYRHIQRYGDVFNRQLLCFTGFQKSSLTDNELLEMAKENLSKINFVGIFEEFNDSIDLLCYDCKLPLVNNIPIVNVTNKKPAYAEIDGDTLELIKELNDLDSQLYEYALKLFNDKKRQILQDAVKRNYESFNSYSKNVLNLDTIINDKENLKKGYEAISSENKTQTNMNCGSGEIKIISARVYNSINGSLVIESGGDAFIEIIFKSSIKAENIMVGFVIEDEYGQKIYGTNSLLLNQRISVEKDENYCVIYSLNMNVAEGKYKLNATLHSDKCYSLCSELENNFHRLLDLHIDECYHCHNNITEFIIEGIKGTVFEGIAKLEPSLLSSKVQIMDKTDKEIAEKISLKIKEISNEVEEKSVFFCIVDLMNCTPKIINSTGENPIHISYHWLNENGDTVTVFDGERSLITPSLLPFNHKEYKLKVISPEREGKYRLRVTLVQEGIAWLDELNPCLSEDVIIEVK